MHSQQDPEYKVITTYPNDPKYKDAYYWNLKSGRILQFCREFGASSCVFKVWDLSKPDPVHVYFFQKEDASKHFLDSVNIKKFLQLFLPEGLLLTEINDAIIDLSKQQEFFIRACVLEESFFKDLNFCTDLGIEFVNVNWFFDKYFRKKRPGLFKDKCFQLSENEFGILKLARKNSLSLGINEFEEYVEVQCYSQTYNEEKESYQIKLINKPALPCDAEFCQNYNDDKLDYFTISENTLAVKFSASIHAFYVFHFAIENDKLVFFENSKVKLQENTSEVFPISMHEIIFNGNVMLHGKNHFTFNKLDLKTLKWTVTPFEQYNQDFYNDLPKRFIPTNLNFLLYEFDVDSKPSLFFYDVNTATIQFLNYPTHISGITVTPSGQFIFANDDTGFQLIEFPKLADWLKHENQTLDDVINNFVELLPVKNIIKEYIANDVKPSTLYGNFFNYKKATEPEIFDKPFTNEPLKKSFCTIL